MTRPVVRIAFFLSFLVFTLIANDLCEAQERSFVIDYDGNTFLKDGQPFRYISGSIHYSRVPSAYWKDRLTKMYHGGLNAIQTYVPWNFHETTPGKYNFVGDANISEFLTIAKDIGLLVILRPGPYICAEWDFGGFPAWLLRNTSIALRTSDEAYLAAVDSWMKVLLPVIKPFLYSNGGPIISVQVENEYGSYKACDHEYMRHLYQLFRSILGDDVIYFTTDGAANYFLKCGTLQGVYSTVDFGAGGDPEKSFAAQRKYEPKGPLVNSEFYTGWLDHWGEKHQTVSMTTVAQSLDKMLSLGANVNMYMYEGGTNFGFWNGANGGGKTFQPQPTSYDYDAPLTEAGDITEKYYAIRNVIAKYSPIPSGPVPPSIAKYPYGFVKMTFQTSLLDALDKLSPYGPINTTYPITMEQMQQYSGFILYRTVINSDFTTPVPLNSTAIRDRGYIMINSVPQGILSRIGALSVDVTTKSGDILDILVENQGHINYGPDITDPKGIFGNVTLNGTILQNWSIYQLNLDGVIPPMQSRPKMEFFRKHMKASNSSLEQASFYIGTLPDISELNPPHDTYLKMSGWSKGQVFINGFNLGRYWPVRGPQITLYVPATILKPSPQKNTVLLLELEKAPCDETYTCVVEFIDRPIINGTIHGNSPNALHGRWMEPL